MIIDKTPTEGAIRISETIDEHLVTRVYYFMSQQEAVEAFQEEFNENKWSIENCWRAVEAFQNAWMGIWPPCQRMQDRVQAPAG